MSEYIPGIEVFCVTFCGKTSEGWMGEKRKLLDNFARIVQLCTTMAEGLELAKGSDTP